MYAIVIGLGSSFQFPRPTHFTVEATGVCLGTDSSYGSASYRLTGIVGRVVEVGEGQETALKFNQAYERICLPARGIAGHSQAEQ